MIANKIQANIVDIPNKKVFFGEILFTHKIISITKLGDEKQDSHYVLPGFVDSHIHIESSMLVPSEFARLAVVHGTVATISDPHEIANVCGVSGVQYMIDNSLTVPFKFHFGAPSCVPATSFETAGDVLNAKDVDALLASPHIYYLSEVMNFPGVLHGDEDLMAKIAAAKKHNKPVDGHAPGLGGEDAIKYINAGISTDHECFTAAEALHKLKHGMKILIREGSAAKNFEALIPLLDEHYENMMFCSDDMHPDSLVAGHINLLVKRAIDAGNDLYKVLQAACINPVEHYKMRCGLLREKDAADFIVVKDMKDFSVIKTYLDGVLVAETGSSLLRAEKAEVINNFSCEKKLLKDFAWQAKEGKQYFAIEALDGQLITNKLSCDPKIEDGKLVSDPENDLLKIAVVNRYNNAKVAFGLIKNFGLTHGALASTVAHDSHNIIAVGVNDEALCDAVNALIDCKGGVAATDGKDIQLLPLPVAGLMTNEDGYETAKKYETIDAFTKETLKSTLQAPFMTLSFMALLVIPHLKLSDKGLFDGDRFCFV